MSKNMKIFILLLVVGMVVFCCCIGTLIIALVASESNSPDMTEEFVSFLYEYDEGLEEKALIFENEIDECDKNNEIDELMDGLYREDEINQLYENIPRLIDEEWECYRGKSEQEIDINKALYQNVSSINCDFVDESEVCRDFSTGLVNMINLEEEINSLLEEDYAEWRDSYICFIDSFRDNYGNDDAVQAGYGVCNEKYVEDYDDVEKLRDEHNEVENRLQDTMDEYLGE